MRRWKLVAALCVSAWASGIAIGADNVRTVDRPPVAGRNRFYVSNRDPLRPNAFVKLPVGSITPGGWVHNELVLEANGMTGHLEEISEWLDPKTSAWMDPSGKGKHGWEEMPYWLKGYGDLGYVLNDPQIIAHTKKWIDAILASQDESGWFGPRELLTSINGKPDLWANMLALNCLQSWYDYSHDERVIPFMTKYFKWELNYPEKDFLVGYWPKIRGGDNLESVYWLYNRTAEPWLLDVAKKIHDHTSNWTRGVINLHNVNFAQSFREPAEYWQQAKDETFLNATQRDYDEVMGTWGQVPGGGFGADENARKGYIDPRQGFETCGMVEYMHSFEMLMTIAGDPRWIDHCEDVAFNSFPAASTPDLKALHYLTCPNQVSLDPNNKAPGINNSGTMFSYSPGGVYRCCQHNVAMGWPYYAENLWLATPDNGLCASLYMACDVTAKVGDGGEVKINEKTDYPFSDTIELQVSAAKPETFPLYLRVPGWCDSPEVKINDMPTSVPANPDSFIVIDRAWKDGDRVTLRLPMKLTLRVWHKNHDAISVDRGPLTFALDIGQTWKKYGGSEQWPEMEVLPSTPWNYGLIVDEKNPAASFEVIEKHGGPLAEQPWTPQNVPIELKAKGKRIPQWTTDAKQLLRPLQESPVKSDAPVEPLTLIPMGGARLRISAFPVISDSPDAHAWTAASAQGPKASWCFEGDTTTALNDGMLPKSSDDQTIPRFTWWPHKGSQEWVEYDFAQPRKLSGASVYWFDDTGRGQCRTPESWEIQYLDGSDWRPVRATGTYGVAKDGFNSVSLDPVETTSVRLVAHLKPDFSAGILELQIR
jgi:hypothetical protein